MVSHARIANREIVYLPVGKISPNPYQPRRFFERAKLEELAQSIKEYGVMQPVSVRLINGMNYELVAGERRLRASIMAGIPDIPAIIVNIKDQESAMLAMIENIQRQDLNYLEEADGLQNLLTDYGFTQEELAEKIGKSQSTIANKLRILKLPKEVQKQLIQYGLSERHARALLSLSTQEQQLEVIAKVVEGGLTVKNTEDYIERMNCESKEKKPMSNVLNNVKRYVRDVRLFTNTVKQAVEVMRQSGVATDYQVTEKENGCEITISVTY